MSSQVEIITEENLSHAWGRAFTKAATIGVGDFAPLVITVTGFSREGIPAEDLSIRQALDNALTAHETDLSCHTVANTIFPETLWHPERPRARLYERFSRLWPHIKDCPLNRQGHYFRRLTAFGEGETRVNQLEHVLNTWARENHRRSALQAAIFDPKKDHTNMRRQLFPCLHQVAFIPTGDDSLSVIGYYGLQYLFQRAYGNYLGLCRLGRFMAHEMNLKLVRMTCVASAAKLEETKQSIRDLSERVQAMLPAA